MRYNFCKFIKNVEFQKDFPTFKTFRCIDMNGTPVSDVHKQTDFQLLNKIYDRMLMLDETDKLLYMAQRQGKISFYMTSFGESAAILGSAAGYQFKDLIFPQYREQGALIWRGFTVEDMINNCMGNEKDLGKGRQMPVHYGSSALNYMTTSSPLTTQVPQAAGAGYSFRMNNEDRIAVTYFGEGAASEGDFHSAMNFAQTLKCQTLFICRNNHYAISTPIQDQYSGDGIVVRGPSYGMASIRVDGNDAVAVLLATQKAREYIIENKQPVLMELMTYRVGDHSTSDHSVLYRSEQELKDWLQQNNPIIRLSKYLESQNQLQINQEQSEELRAQYKNECIQALKKCSQYKYLNVKHLFTDVYDELTDNLKEQQKQLEDHLAKYPEKYNLHKYN